MTSNNKTRTAGNARPSTPAAREGVAAASAPVVDRDGFVLLCSTPATDVVDEFGDAPGEMAAPDELPDELPDEPPDVELSDAGVTAGVCAWTWSAI
jgi:hypothetical protein